MNEKWKWGTAGRLRRGAVILGVVGLTAGAGLATAGSALAGVGSAPGQLQLSEATGPLTDTPTWSTTSACPTGFQAAAHVTMFSLTGTLISIITPNVTTGLTAPFSGTLQGSVGALLNFAGFNATTPGTVEWAVGCFSGAGGTGNVEYVQSLFVSVASGATTFTTSSSAPTQVKTTTTLAVSPSTGVTTATSVTLTATVTAADSTSPAGNVAFNNGSTVIATVPVTWSASTGTATTSTTFTSPGSFPLTATFTPTPQTYSPSTSATSTLTVTQAGSTNATGANPVVINVTVAATGTLAVSVAAGPVNLSNTANPLVGTGTLPTVTISDTRNNFPGWSVEGQESNFTSTATPSTPISGNQLGWAPTAVNSPLPNGAVLGGNVAAGTTGTGGLGSAPQVLALAHAGTGADPSGATNDQVSANLTLDIPPTTTAGAYTGNLTVTYLSAQA